MITNETLTEFKKMWTWLYSHPAHNQKYYIKHVIKVEPAWEKDCPICHQSGGKCDECNALWDKGNGTLCEDLESPLNRWRNTHLSDPNYRMWYAGKVIDLAEKAARE